VVTLRPGEHCIDLVAKRRAGAWCHDLPELWPVACCYVSTRLPDVVELAPGS
jgi:hypothetical protein